jgi:hypothetical protein
MAQSLNQRLDVLDDFLLNVRYGGTIGFGVSGQNKTATASTPAASNGEDQNTKTPQDSDRHSKEAVIASGPQHWTFLPSFLQNESHSPSNGLLLFVDSRDQGSITPARTLPSLTCGRES